MVFQLYHFLFAMVTNSFGARLTFQKFGMRCLIKETQLKNLTNDQIKSSLKDFAGTLFA